MPKEPSAAVSAIKAALPKESYLSGGELLATADHINQAAEVCQSLLETVASLREGARADEKTRTATVAALRSDLLFLRQLTTDNRFMGRIRDLAAAPADGTDDFGR